MRKLTTLQKQLLKEYLKQESSKGTLQRFYDWDDLPKHLQEKLVLLNDYETLWSDSQRFLVDEALKQTKKRN